MTTNAVTALFCVSFRWALLHTIGTVGVLLPVCVQFSHNPSVIVMFMFILLAVSYHSASPSATTNFHNIWLCKLN